jgi:FdhE protein
MTRILAPGEIEDSAQRTPPRIRLPDRISLFARAQRLRQLGEPGAPGHAIGDYLRLMATVAEAQQAALTTFEPPRLTAAQLAQSRTHRMPLIHATGWLRAPVWRELVRHVCGAVVAKDSGAPGDARAACRRLVALPPEALEAQADALLSPRPDAIDLATAPFLMAALQADWVALASHLAPEDLPELEVPGVCPTCGSLPVASIVRADLRSQGYRYLHCALCATEWHFVRVTCSHCQSTERVSYYSIDGGPAAVRAEACDHCRTYRKILYQEKDSAVEPVADDLASIALDVLMAEAGYHRASGNPLLWQSA